MKRCLTNASPAYVILKWTGSAAGEAPPTDRAEVPENLLITAEARHFACLLNTEDDVMPEHDTDTTSQITTSARNLTVLDDAGDFAGAAQQFMTERSTEVEALEHYENPSPLPGRRTVEQHALDMLRQGKVLCLRCQTFKYAYLFTKVEGNPERLNCYSYCRKCASEKIQGKRQVLRNGQRSEGYRYQERRKKRRKRK